jgi:hypothetical protein
MQIDLNEAEAALSREILHQAYQDLREEIYKTDASRFKEQLKERERLLEGLVAKFGG